MSSGSPLSLPTPKAFQDYGPAYATKEESSDDGVIKFKAEKDATWDWKDIYSVASAKGTICFFSDHHEIRVDEYSYYAAG